MESLQKSLQSFMEQQSFAQIIGAIAIAVIGWILAKFVRKLTASLLKRREVDGLIIGFFSELGYWTILLTALIAAFNRLGVNTTSLVAIFGAAGLAVGLAFKDVLANFAAGLMIVFFRPFKAGDYVEAGGVAGSVEKVQAHATHLCTPDNKHIIVPNSAIVGANIINYSAKDRRRVDMVFGVGYRSDIKQVKTILQNALAKDPRVLSDPEPTVALGNLGASSLDFFVRPWVKTADYWGFFFDYQETIKNAFDQEGIEIPFPQSDVHLFVEADHRGQKG